MWGSGFSRPVPRQHNRRTRRLALGTRACIPEKKYCEGVRSQLHKRTAFPHFLFPRAHPTQVRDAETPQESERVQVVIIGIAASTVKNLRKSSGIQTHANDFLMRLIVLHNYEITRLAIRVIMPIKFYLGDLFFLESAT